MMLDTWWIFIFVLYQFTNSIINVNLYMYTTVQNFRVGNYFFFFKKLILLFSKDTLNWPKIDSKDIYNVKKLFLFQINAVLSNFLSIKGYWKQCITVSMKIWSSTIVFNIDNNQKCFWFFWAANQHIRIISEGSCDTEDWSNDAENSALITGINYI